MAAQDYTSVVQQLYVSYFGRPADFYGLQNFSAALDAMGAPTDFAELNAAVQADTAGTSALSQLVNSFNSSAESAALYGTDNSQIGIGKFVNAIYQNVLGRDADLSGFNFWVNAITSGTLTKANAAASITQAALDNTSDQGKLDALTVQHKLAVATAFTTGLDTPAEITAFSGEAAAANARSLLAGVNSSTDVTAYQATIDNSIGSIVDAANPGKTFSLTTGVDTLVGTAGNDVFVAENDSTTGGFTFGSFDNINGGGGKNTLNIVDTHTDATNFSLPTSATITNIQNLNVSSTTSGTVGVDASTIAGVTSVKLSTTAANDGDTVKVGDGVAVSVNSAGGTVAVDGGSDVTVNAKGAVTIGATAAPTGAVAVTTANAAAATAADAAAGAISIKGGSTVTVTENLVAPTPVAGTLGDVNAVGGAVTINGTAATTTVSVTQTAAVDSVTGAAAVDFAPAVDAVKQVDKVSIGTVADTDVFTVTVDGADYTYTANATDAAADVAAALAAKIAAATGVAVTAVASGSDITLTANTAGTAFAATPATTNVTVTETTPNKEAVAETPAADAVDAVGGIVNGTVSITDLNSANTDGTKANTITTVNLDGYGAGSTIKSNALTSLTLANSAKGVTVIDNTATPTNTTLNVTVNKLSTGASLTDNTIKTLNITAGADGSTLAVNAAADTKLTVAGAGKLSLDLAGAGVLKTVDASAATGAVTLKNVVATSVTTGSGNDTVTSYAATMAAVAAVAATDTTAAIAAKAAVNATVLTGAGNDTIDMTHVHGTGNFTVNGGDGNDTIKVTQAQLVAGNTIDGGAGTDTLVLTNNATFAAGDFALINSLVTNVEGVEFKNAVTIDASKIAFTSMTFDAVGSTVTGVTSQALSTSASVDSAVTTTFTANASGYAVATSTADATYAGNLNVTSTGANANLSLNADTATVNVKASIAGNAVANIGGDLQTSLTVNLTNSANASSSPTADNVAHANVLVDADNNVALKSVVLTGAGTVTIDASHSVSLSNVDASQLGGTVANGDTKGAITDGLEYFGNAAIAETITLGSGHDIVHVASTYNKMDTIVGFDAVKEGTTAASTTDVLEFNGIMLNGDALTGSATHTAGISSLTLTSADSTLDLAFVHAAAASHANATPNSIVQFQFGGNTYLFADNGNGTLDNADFAVKLVGTIDLTAGFGVPATAA